MYTDMIRDLGTNKSRGFLAIRKKPMGLGFKIDFNPPMAVRETRWSIEIDLIFLRFWWIQYKE